MDEQPTQPGLTIWTVTGREYGDTETDVTLFASEEAALAWCHEADAETAEMAELEIADLWTVAEEPLVGGGYRWQSDEAERQLMPLPVLTNRR
jgi:hypothetical protein